MGITRTTLDKLVKEYDKPSFFQYKRTYQNIIKENNFYLLSCNRSTKKLINKRIKNLKNPPKNIEIIEEMETIKLQRKYIGKYFPFGDTIEIDARIHPWFNDEKRTTL